MQRHWQAQDEPAPRLCSGNNSEGDQSDCLKPEGILMCLEHKQVGQRQRLGWGMTGNPFTAACSLSPTPVATASLGIIGFLSVSLQRLHTKGHFNL